MTSGTRVLVVEDDAAAARVMRMNLDREGFTTRIAEDAAAALGALEELAPNVLVTDHLMPGLTGLELLAEVRRRDPSIPVIVMTGHGDERLAVQSMREGAFTYLAKPLDYDELALVCRRAAELHRLRQQLEAARNLELGHGLVGESPAICRLRRLIAEVAPTDVTVLVRGETGTGKEVVARAIHAASKRPEGPFVAVNCAAIFQRPCSRPSSSGTSAAPSPAPSDVAPAVSRARAAAPSSSTRSVICRRSCSPSCCACSKSTR